jgi:hypothetical protein
VDQPAAEPHAAGDDAIDLEAAVELQVHLDDRVACDEIGMPGIANHQVADFLGAEADAVQMILGLHSAPLELALEEVSGDRPALDPHGEDREDDQGEDQQRGKGRQPRPPRRSSNDDVRPLRRAEPLVSRPLVHRAF